jgi:hypothetical protein
MYDKESVTTFVRNSLDFRVHVCYIFVFQTDWTQTLWIGIHEVFYSESAE